MATTQTTGKTVHFLRTYRFREKEKDPIIDRIHSLMDETGYSVADVANGSGLSWGTVNNWIDGETRRPQYCSVVAAARSMGYDVALVPTKNKANGHAWDAAMPQIVKRFRVERSSSS